jgi:hypothetical protein
VKPELPIVNYRTQWSGVSEGLLESVTVTLEQAQLAFLRIISRETFLIGEFEFYYVLFVFLLFLIFHLNYIFHMKNNFHFFSSRNNSFLQHNNLMSFY